MERDRGYWVAEALTNQDAAVVLAGRVAMLEGLEPGTEEWADRAVELFEQARERLTLITLSPETA